MANQILTPKEKEKLLEQKHVEFREFLACFYYCVQVAEKDTPLGDLLKAWRDPINDAKTIWGITDWIHPECPEVEMPIALFTHFEALWAESGLLEDRVLRESLNNPQRFVRQVGRLAGIKNIYS